MIHSYYNEVRLAVYYFEVAKSSPRQKIGSIKVVKARVGLKASADPPHFPLDKPVTMCYIIPMSKTYDFYSFKRQVNYAVQRRLGCSIYDLPDTIVFDDYWHNDCKTHEDDFWNAVESATDDLLWANGFDLDINHAR